ncbi:hypothetical protein NQ315_008966 [Exocentrus adspersus]|uniref:Tyr recombinase domain-containing protein n=1 Tax=Exocentrus adspersus TaxID=1586481 RepID=A0AAV8VIF9_9CUCU|nr:hypothetical protein NQ315_008966 [Exocentrus adspersus]
MNADISEKSSKTKGKLIKGMRYFVNGAKTMQSKQSMKKLCWLISEMCKNSLAKYSMVKSMLMVNENIDMSKFSKAIAFLKKESVSHQSKQSKVLTREEVDRFMKEAPIETFLLIKVVVLLGISGGCRREELYNLNDADIQDTGSQLIVSINQTKTYVKRVFTVTEENFLLTFRQYRRLRPKDISGNEFFIGYRKANVSIHSIGGAPRKIAEFLKLDHSERYTGHCFRRTSSTLLANAGADVTILKRHGGWKSTFVAEKYVEESFRKSLRNSDITDKLFEGIPYMSDNVWLLGNEV